MPLSFRLSFQQNHVCLSQKLEFTVGDEIPHSPDGKGLTPAEIQMELLSLLAKNANNEEVFDWVEAAVGQQNIKQHYFIRALTTAVCRGVIDGKIPWEFRL